MARVQKETASGYEYGNKYFIFVMYFKKFFTKTVMSDFGKDVNGEQGVCLLWQVIFVRIISLLVEVGDAPRHSG